MQSSIPEPWFASFRAEGLPLRQAALHAPAYLAKYWYKRADPDGLERHFHEARTAVEATVGRAPPGAVSVGFVGDLMWVRNGWEDILGASLRARLGGFQLLVGNLETPVAPALQVPGEWPDALRYNALPSYLRAWAGAGVPWPQLLLGLANNHSWDCGAQGAVETMAELEWPWRRRP